MIRIDEIKLPINYSDVDLYNAVAKRLKSKVGQFKNVKLVRKSMDARKKEQIHFVVGVTLDFVGNEDKKIKQLKDKKITKAVNFSYKMPMVDYGGRYRPVVVGAGPCGIFAALVLAEAGLKPLVIEGGKDVVERKKDVENFWQKGLFSPSSNVQFGEGGAGAFSDGKLTTGTKDLRHRRILADFVKAGAPEEILYLAKPHIGSDNLPHVVENLRRRIENLGGEYRFSTLLKDIIVEKNAVTGIVVESDLGTETWDCDRLILALGHSARNTYEMLYSHGVAMEPKAFSLGVRIEHSQSAINIAQFGVDEFGAADYKLAVHLPNGRSAYTFCMCPGGVVVGAASENGGVVTNGMSVFARDGVNANSALLIGVTPQDFPGDEPLAGMRWQRDIEAKAFLAGGGDFGAPCQRLGDFMEYRPSLSCGKILPTYLPRVQMGEVASCLPDFIGESIAMAIPLLAAKLKIFDDPDALLTAPETRSSAPVKILRDEGGESSIKGLYPAGEGSGYAGGIMSSAADGLKIGENVLKF